MLHHKNIRILLAIIVLQLTVSFGRCADLPCIARDVGISGRSIVCVCNATYCDTITREAPARGKFITYTSTKAGKRFEKSGGSMRFLTNILNIKNKSTKDWSENIASALFNDASYQLVSSVQYQAIEGFGGAVTDSAGINWRKLSASAQLNLIRTYFGPEGIEYNFIRVPIAGTDFSTHPYTYNDYPWNDATLSNFSLTVEDYDYKLPMIKKAQEEATSEIKITASTWSPPIWMKTNENITGFGQLKKEYYQIYADYHIRFLEEYKKENVYIWALSTTNEPINGIIPIAPFNSLGWFPWDLGRWVANNFGPTIRNSRFNKTLILAVEDQRYLLLPYLIGMRLGDSKSMEYIDGIAVHNYINIVPASTLSFIQKQHPGKILMATEYCAGSMPWDEYKVKIGSWDRADEYVKLILDDLNNFVAGWIDWNLCLDDTGGPNWAENYVDSAILVYGDTDEFVKQPMFYALGHFAKFIPRGSKRIQVIRKSLGDVPNLAVITPEGNIVVVLHNTKTSKVKVRLSTGLFKHADVTLEPESITTVEINNQ